MNKITIIIPIYKENEKTLNLCFESIKKQTCFDFDVVLVINGKNNLEKYIKMYFEKMQDVHIISLEHNIGYCGARQMAINASKTEYVSFLDADDRLSELYIDEFYKTINHKDYDLIFINFNTFSNNKILKKNNMNTNEEVSKNKIRPYMKHTAGWTKIINLNFLKNNNINFIIDESNIIEDMFFHMCLLYKFKTSFYIGKTFMYEYYFRKNSTINQLISEGKCKDITNKNTIEFCRKYRNDKHFNYFLFRYFLYTKQWPWNLYLLYKYMEVNICKRMFIFFILIPLVLIYHLFTIIRGY